MKVLILGIDGYLGWPLAMRLANKGHKVYGIDDLSRRRRVMERGSDSAIPITTLKERVDKFAEKEPKAYEINYEIFDLRNTKKVMDYFNREQVMGNFDAIVHFGEIPSAPYSMKNVHNAIETHEVNVNGTLNILWAMKEYCPEAHLIKLGTMGEYGTPGVTINEGFCTSINGEEADPKAKLLFPRSAGSFYHQTKVHDTNNVLFACKMWNIKSTDIMQGVVYGTITDEINLDPKLKTRFDFDGTWGTVVNRFCVQAILGIPLTVYGKGGQTRGYLNIRDTMNCIETILERPPEAGEYRTINQFTEVMSVNQIAQLVKKHADKLGLCVKIESIPNPRIESEQHKYPVISKKLRELGFEITQTMEANITEMLRDLMKHKDRLEAFRESVMPEVNWGR